MTVVHAGGACEDRRNSIGAGLRKGLEKLSLLPGGKGAGLFGRDKGAAAAQPGPPGARWRMVLHVLRCRVACACWPPAVYVLQQGVVLTKSCTATHSAKSRSWNSDPGAARACCSAVWPDRCALECSGWF